MSASRVYEGRMRHARVTPVEHVFGYSMCQLYLDLDELPTLFDRYWLWSARRPALARFRRTDHHGPADVPLAEAIRDLVQTRTGHRPHGPIRLLTHARYCGHGFNPVSFYYCFEPNGERLRTIVAEINNTPWGEQHCYVLDREAARVDGEAWVFDLDKDFHISPFMPLEQRYRWRFWPPGACIKVRMETYQDGERVFDAGLSMRARPLDGSALARVLLAYPLMTIQVIAAIYWQALRLKLKGVPVHDHPGATPHRAPDELTRAVPAAEASR